MRKLSLSQSQRKFAGLLILLIGLSWLLLRSRSPKETIKTILSQKLNDQNVKYWTAISAFETAGWTSDIYKENHNLFGMRLPSKNTTAIGENRGHAVFKDDAGSAKDLLLYFDRLNWSKVNYSSIDEIVQMQVAKGYFTADPALYLSGAKQWYKKLYPEDFIGGGGQFKGAGTTGIW
jgi:hypothetical protein